MFLNTIKPAAGSKKNNRRLGRGIGSGCGKTSGKGHKGQRARAGGYHKVGFEGGQSPLQRRLPKFGFTSVTANTMAEVRLGELNKVKSDEITLDTLREAGIINFSIKRAKVIATGKIERAVRLLGVHATKGARLAIEAAGGTVEE